MKTLFAVGFASLYGLIVRLLFGFMKDFMDIMSITFLVLVPIFIGFLTVILLPKVINDVAAFFLPWLTSLVILFITIALNIEGAICWIMVFPFFAILAGIGGTIANSIKKRNKRNKDLNKNDWGKPNTLNVSALFFVPALLGYLEGERTLIPIECTVTKQIVIAASPAEVWQQLTHINELKETEKHASFSTWMGFPRHLRTVADTFAVGGTRFAVYEKGLYFKETISEYVPNRRMVLDIKTDPDNIPPTVMDEHILIGGKHLDILKDEYNIEALPDGSSRLSLSSRFRINTPLNWYSGLWADYLMADILVGELELVKARTTGVAETH
jgi:uncharacterized protein YndB with AHSA1/START domain